MTLAGAFFSKRARTSAHIVWGSLNEISEDFTEDLERDGCKSETASSSTRSNGYSPKTQNPKPQEPGRPKGRQAPQKKRRQMPAFVER
jgi:hypothetical protein